jgi:serine O-acetyltransferase
VNFKLIDDLREKRALYSEYRSRPSRIAVVLADGTAANALYRLMRWLVGLRLTPLAFLVHLLNKWMNGCVIGLGADFDSGLVLIHPVGIIINSRVRGGRNIRVESGVVIGENRGECPRLADNIFIGSGAKIIGAVTVGSNSRIGANAVVLHDVAAGTTVVGIPAKPLHPRLSEQQPR